MDGWIDSATSTSRSTETFLFGLFGLFVDVGGGVWATMMVPFFLPFRMLIYPNYRYFVFCILCFAAVCPVIRTINCVNPSLPSCAN